jgi:plastocyanin
MLWRFCAAGSLAGLTVAAGDLDSAAETIRVNVAQLAFVPAQVSAHIGDTIEWVSTDFVAHTAAARSKEWDITVPPKRTGSVVPRPWGWSTIIAVSPNMKGRVMVEIATTAGTIAGDAAHLHRLPL